MIEIRRNSKWRNVSFGMIPRMCRRHGLYRNRNTPVFTRHTVGLGGVYVYCNEDTIRVRADELGIDFTTKEIFKVRNILENIDRMEDRLALEWKKVLEQ